MKFIKFQDICKYMRWGREGTIYLDGKPIADVDGATAILSEVSR